MRDYLAVFLLVLLSGCTLTMTSPATAPAGVPPQVRLPSVTPPADAAPVVTVTGGYQLQQYPGELVDALPVMSGICFEAAQDAAGRVFILRSAEDHIQLYNLADNAGLCRQPVARYPFDFSGGAVLAGGWSRGSGCTARHEVTAYERNDDAQTIVIDTRFLTEGDCPYELVRPFWVAIPGAVDYDIALRLDN